MSLGRRIALTVLLVVAVCSLCAEWIAPQGYKHQSRESANAAPSQEFPLGTDELGRDRLARLLHGTRISLLLAPASALLATAVALVLGLLAGALRPSASALILGVSDLFSSIPWLFLLIAVRAALPLDVEPGVSVAFTFALLGLLGWASSVRVIRAAVLRIRQSEYLLQGLAAGCSQSRILFVHIASGLKPVLKAQFWILVPQFLLAEANLGFLGLGVTEPLPSWGNLLADLQNYTLISDAPWRLAPAALLLLVMVCLQKSIIGREIAQ